MMKTLVKIQRGFAVLSSSTLRAASKLTFALVFCLLVAVAAQAKGYVIAEAGNCVTVTFNYDDKGNFLGNTTSSGACTIPDGVYPFALVINPATQNPTPLSSATKASLTRRDPLYNISLQILDAVRAADKGSLGRSRPATKLSREYARVIEEGLKNGVKVAVSVPPGYVSESMQLALTQ